MILPGILSSTIRVGGMNLFKSLRSQQYRNVVSRPGVSEYQLLTQISGLPFDEVVGLERYFRSFDYNCDSLLDRCEFYDILESLTKKNHDMQDMDKIFALMDRNCDDVINLEEFVVHLSKRVHKPYTKFQATSAFVAFDGDADGKLTNGQFKLALFYLGQEVTHSDVNRFFHELADRDSRLGFREFERYLFKDICCVRLSKLDSKMSTCCKKHEDCQRNAHESCPNCPSHCPRRVPTSVPPLPLVEESETQ